MENPVLIAEAGCNHMGQIDIAKTMIDSASVFCEISHIKFQKRNICESLSPEQYRSKHPVPENSFGETYGLHREHLEFTIDQHRELQEYGERQGIKCSTSVWDITSLREVIELNPIWIKIPSSANTNLKLLEVVCNEYQGEIHISLGMTTRTEEEKILENLQKYNRLKDVVLYACTSGYPVQFDEICLLEIPRLMDQYGDELMAVGFSGHHLGIAVDIAAFTLGARYIERHFTLNRTWKGTDHAASLEPDGMRKLRRNLDHTVTAMSLKKSEILKVEEPQRRKLKQLG